MELSDLLIIYFAAGTPFGVYRITTLYPTPNKRDLLYIALCICLWPLYMTRLLRDQFSAPAGSIGVLDAIRSEIEQLAFANGSASAVFDFREIFNRYAGLCEAANTEVPTNVFGEFFDLAASENKPLASACVARRNREKLVFHRASSRDEFVELIADIAINDPQILALAIRHAVHLDDGAAVEDLKAIYSKPARPTGRSAMQRARPAQV